MKKDRRSFHVELSRFGFWISKVYEKSSESSFFEIWKRIDRHTSRIEHLQYDTIISTPFLQLLYE